MALPQQGQVAPTVTEVQATGIAAERIEAPQQRRPVGQAERHRTLSRADWAVIKRERGVILPELELGIADRITWRGALAQDELLAEYRKADLFALACRIARDGDRDGLPNVLAEAQSQGLPCVATRVSAIPELIRDDTGLLVSEADTVAFAGALQALITDPARRRALGDALRARARAAFAIERTADVYEEIYRRVADRDRRAA